MRRKSSARVRMPCALIDSRDHGRDPTPFDLRALARRSHSAQDDKTVRLSRFAQNDNVQNVINRRR